MTAGVFAMAMLPLLTVATEASAGGAEPTMPVAFDCVGDNVSASYAAEGPSGEPLFLVNFREQWAIADRIDDLAIESTTLGELVTAVATPVPDGSIERVTLILPRDAEGGLPERFLTNVFLTREFNFLPGRPRDSQAVEVSCTGVEAPASVVAKASGVIAGIGDDFIDVFENGTVRRISREVDTTTTLDGYWVSAADTLGNGIAVKVFIDGAGVARFIAASRSRVSP